MLDKQIIMKEELENIVLVLLMKKQVLIMI